MYVCVYVCAKEEEEEEDKGRRGRGGRGACQERMGWDGKMEGRKEAWAWAKSEEKERERAAKKDGVGSFETLFFGLSGGFSRLE